jgi:vitamin B12 transporter
MKRILHCCLILLLPGHINAQEKKDSTMIVKPASVEEEMYAIPEVRITGFRLSPRPNNLHSSKFDREELGKQGSFSVADVLQTQTNAYIKTYGPNTLASPSIRGSGASHTQVYWNGLPINSPTLGQSDLSILNTEIMDQVSINYGSDLSSSSGALGGSIELNDKLRWQKSSSISYRQRSGSFSSRSSSIYLQESSDNLYFSAAAVYASAVNNFSYIDRSVAEPTSQHMENADFMQQGGTVTIGYKQKKHEVKFSGLMSKADRGLPVIMGATSKGERQRDDSFMGVMDYQYLGARFQNQLKLGSVSLVNRYANPAIDLSAEHVSQVLIFQNEAKFLFKELWSINSRMAGRLEQAISSSYSGTKSRDLFSNYTEFERSGKRTKYTARIRTEMIGQELAAVLPGLSGWIVLNNKGLPLRIKWNASKNYRLPSLNDLYWLPGGNPDLLPELGYSADLGISSDLKLNNEDSNKTSDKRSGNWFEITGFYANISNWILWTPTGHTWSPQNLKRVRNSGVEVSYRGSRSFSVFGLGHSLTINMCYSLIDSKVLESEVVGDQGVGKSLIFIPKHNMKYNLEYQVMNWSLIFGQCLTGKVYLDAINESYMPYYGPSYLIISKQIQGVGDSRLKLGVKMNNLFNEEYQVMPYRPMPGFNVNVMGEIVF